MDKGIMKKIWVLIVTLFMAITSFINPIIIKAASSDEVKNWEQLQQAIENASDGDEIIVASDIAIEDTLNVTNNITIKGKDGGSYTLFQKKRDSGSYDTMFLVSGNLTLGKNLTLSGTNGSCKEVSVDSGLYDIEEVKEEVKEKTVQYDIEEVKAEVEQKTGQKDITHGTYTLDDFKDEGSGPSAGEKWLAFNSAGQTSPETSINIGVFDNQQDAITHLGTYITIEGTNIVCQRENESKKTLYLNGYQLQFGTPSQYNPAVTVGTNGELKVIYQNGNVRYVTVDGSNLGISSTGPGVYVIGSSPLSVSTTEPTATTWTIPAGGTTYYTEAEAQAALDNYNNSIWVVDGQEFDNYDDAKDAASYTYWVIVGDTSGTEYGSEQEAKDNAPVIKWIVNGEEYFSEPEAQDAATEIYWYIEGKEDVHYETKEEAEEHAEAIGYKVNGVTYDTRDEAEEHQEYWYVDGDESVKYDSYDEAQAKADEMGGCTVEPCLTYNKDNFEGGSLRSPKGFFVHVKNGGSATLAGATLEHFYTDTTKANTVRFVAPVVVDGGTFDIQDGVIQNNVVGYIANDSNSNESADVIKRYVKGGAPNAPRAGSNANSDNRRWSKATIDEDDAASGITGTAGAIIYINGASGEISGGSISYNRGDTGGIMVSGDGTNVKITGADVSVDHNVGVQWGGGSFVEDGGFLLMTNGIMSENVAWFGGGAVFATENGIAWLTGVQTDYGSRKDGKFTLDGGTLDNNTAFTRGGAILADSDGVALLKGTLSNNKSRMLGGAVYVMGDDPRYTYMVYVKNGYIHDNQAVSATTNKDTPATSLSEDKDANMALSKILNSASPCGHNEELFTKNMTVNSDDLADGPGTDGTGGGVWLCAYGNTNFNLSDDTFVVDHNYASGSVKDNINGKTNKATDDGTSSKTGGNDIHKDTKGSGSATFTAIGNDFEWYNENTGNLFTEEIAPNNGVIVAYGSRNLVNKKNRPAAEYSPDNYDGIDVYGNISRRGGGFAANGTYIFGNRQDVANIYGELEITKIWANTTEKDVAVRVSAEREGEKCFIEIVPLSQTAQETSELDTVFVEDNYTSHFTIPMMVEKDGKMVQILDLKIGDKTYDLTNVEDLKELAQKIDKGETVTLDSSKTTFIFEEGKINEDGEFELTDEYNFIADEVVLADAQAEIKTLTQQIDSERTIDILTASKSIIYLSNQVINDKQHEIEKYINQAVHQNITVNEEFTYDIVAYITMDADKFTITDELVADLEFVSSPTDVKVYDLGTTNNHKVTNNIESVKVNDDATVAKTDKLIDTAEVTITDQTLKVVMDDVVTVDESTGTISRESEDVLNLRGHWVKVSFKAQIAEEKQQRIINGEKPEDVLEFVEIKATETYKDPDSIYTDEDRPEPNVGNQPVASDEDHDGVKNTANYEIEVKKKAKYKDESNTVTVKPDQPQVEKYVNQAVHKDIMVNEVFQYDIIGFVSADADKVTFYDELVEDLELVNVESIKVVSLDENNHKPYKDITNTVVNEDASVKEAGTSIKSNDGVTVNAEENGSVLEVILDDVVTVGEEAGTITRRYETVKNLRGKYVKITFQAQIKKSLQNKIETGEMSITDLSNVKIEENDPVLTDEVHDGIENRATMKIQVGNQAELELETNVVTVKPEQAEIEKYVNQAVHQDIELEDEFTYDIIAYITKDADTVTITDTLDDMLNFVSDASSVKVVDLGTTNNHKVTNNIKAEQVNDDATVAESGKTIDAAVVLIDGKTLTVKIENKLKPIYSDDNPDEIIGYEYDGEEQPVKDLRGHWVKVTFDAKIDGKTLEEVKEAYVKISAKDVEDRAKDNVGNAPVISKEDHTGIPNKASYTIGVANDAGIQEDAYKDTSNTVTVKPREGFPIYISKNELGGEEIEGAHIVVKDENGEIIDEWDSPTDSHKLDLKPGKYTMQETVAPEGYQIVTTIIEFEVDENGKVTLLTKEVDGGGRISLDGNDHIILEDAPIKYVDLPIVKTWDEADFGKDNRPESITFTLYADGEEIDTLEITGTRNTNEWNGKFKNLPATDQNGKEITYTVEETRIPHYYTEIERLDESYKVLNAYRPWIPQELLEGAVGRVTVTKTVSGGAEANKTYHIDVKFTYENGGSYTHSIELRPSENPSYIFDYVPSGTKVEVSEKETGYVTTITMDGEKNKSFDVMPSGNHQVVIDNYSQPSSKVTPKPTTKTPTPYTNDDTNLVLWVSLLFMGLLVVAGSSFVLKKK